MVAAAASVARTAWSWGDRGEGAVGPGVSEPGFVVF